MIVLPRLQAAPAPAGCTSSNWGHIDPQRSLGAKTVATAAEPPPDETATVAATAAVVRKRARRNQPGASEDDGGRGKKPARVEGARVAGHTIDADADATKGAELKSGADEKMPHFASDGQERGENAGDGGQAGEAECADREKICDAACQSLDAGSTDELQNVVRKTTESKRTRPGQPRPRPGVVSGAEGADGPPRKKKACAASQGENN